MNNIVFIGFMAVGKSTIGKEVSKVLNMKFIDTDKEIEKKENMNIDNIFKQKGEKYFRDLETKIIENMLCEKNIVLSTGGGIIEKDYNSKLLRQIGTVIWLDANKDTIMNNLSKSKEERPLLKECNIEERINSIMSRRLQKYKNASHIIIDTNNKSVDEVVCDILFNLNKL
ncbi:shikimate kinase [Alkalithermobacter paradoxus]|uniref:Shikimate kinase n=1 Tax=Alkalithermobacter paradoxus TaxID=29349 RepID=A0A1V4I6M2_9FIRM|nr:shikimate kinase [[Clostridium] thermoalcaliphilum]